MIKGKIKKVLGRKNVSLVKFIRETYFSKSLFSSPLPFNVLRDTLDATNISKGDILLVHSSLNSLLRACSSSSEGGNNTPPLTYAMEVIDLLRGIVGPTGTLLMPAEAIKHPFDFSYKNQIYDYRRAPTVRGLIAELFRRQEGVVRSTVPNMSMCGIGPMAEELILDHDKAAPYFIGEQSPWYKISQLSGAKVLLLGRDFDSNSIMRVPEATHRDEYRAGIWYDKPFPMQYIDRGGEESSIEVAIRAAPHGSGQLEKFAEFLNKKYGIYQYLDIDGLPIRLYDANEQYVALLKEVENDKWTLDANYWP